MGKQYQAVQKNQHGVVRLKDIYQRGVKLWTEGPTANPSVRTGEISFM